MKKSLKSAIKENLSEAASSPAAAFISAAATKPKKPKTEKATEFQVPEGMRLVAEPKSRRFHLLMRPTAYRWAEAKAEAAGISVNEFLNVLIEDAKAKEGGK